MENNNTSKTLVLYFSYSGNTRRIAEAEAAECGADICEIKTAMRLGIIKGLVKAMRGKSAEIQPLTADLADYDTLKLYSPIWGWNIHAAMNAVLERLPNGKDVEIIAVSGSGKSRYNKRIPGIIKERGCKLAGFRDVKA